jgi:steroid delta-isomerase
VSRLDAIKRYYEGLQCADLARLGEYYGQNAYFRDPFNEVRGLPALHRVLEHMFESLDEPRFEFLDSFQAQGQAFLTWDFRFRLRGRALCVHGSSHLKFDAHGKVSHHRDYWDAAEQVWERVPVLGCLMRVLRKRLATPSPEHG